MKFAWKALVASGTALVMLAFGMDTTIQTDYGRVHNLGLQGQQQFLLIVGCALFLAGVILFGVFKIKQSPEEERQERERAELRKHRNSQRGAERVAQLEGRVPRPDGPLLALARRARPGVDRLALRLLVGVPVAGFWAFLAGGIGRSSFAMLLAMVAALAFSLWRAPAVAVLCRLLSGNAVVALLCYAYFLVVRRDDITLADPMFYTVTSALVLVPLGAAAAAHVIARRAHPTCSPTA